jgi:hypothetical protein
MRIQPPRLLALALLMCTSTARAQCSAYWSAVGQETFCAPVRPAGQSMEVFDDGAGSRLYVPFYTTSTTYVSMRRWDGRNWQVVNDGLPTTGFPALRQIAPRVLEEPGGSRLYALCAFQTGSRTAFQWNGSAWLQAHASFHTREHTPMFVADLGDGPRIYGQRRLDTGGAWLTRWDTDHWTQLGQDLTNGFPGGWVLSVELDRSVVPNRLRWAGLFTQGRVIEWAGDHWVTVVPSIPPPFFNGSICAAIYDDGSGPAYYFGGDSGQGPSCIYKWSGSEWVIPGGGVQGNFGGGFTGYIKTMKVFDDGRGPALYVAGFINTAGGQPTPGIARWDGEHWEGLSTGTGGSYGADSMTVFDDGRGPSLFISGAFTRAGAGQACLLAQWVGCTDQCYPDCTNDRRLNVLDFNCFLNSYTASNPYADSNGDGAFNVLDFLTFINRFAAGCGD